MTDTQLTPTGAIGNFTMTEHKSRYVPAHLDIIGGGAANLFVQYQNDTAVSIWAVEVSPETNRRKGYGKALFSLVLARLRDQNIKNVYLWVESKNEGAHAFYESLGFTIHRTDVGDNIEWKATLEL